jgi:hypothetical protein
MLDTAQAVSVTVTPVTAKAVAGQLGAGNLVSCIGHQDTAVVVSQQLNSLLGTDNQKPVSCNRVSVNLKKGDVLFVAQVVGGRLPEGCAVLPDGFTLKYLRVNL